MELQKTNNSNIPTALLPILQREEVQLLASNRWSEVADLLPARIEGTFDLPKVSELVLATGKDSVAAFIEFELVKLSALVSIGGNLSKSQVPFIASELIDLYPNETIADFKICFQRGARGDYGDIYRMDGIVIRKWMNAYLEEKYQVMEDKLMKEKDHPYIPAGPEKIAYAPIKNGLPASPEVAQKYIDELEEKLRPSGKKIPALTEREIKEEGRERPKAFEYKAPDEKYLLTNEKIKIICHGLYKNLLFSQMSEFKKYNVEGYHIYCESQQKAQDIYIEATSL